MEDFLNGNTDANDVRTPVHELDLKYGFGLNLAYNCVRSHVHIFGASLHWVF